MKLPGEELELHSPGKFSVSDGSQLSLTVDQLSVILLTHAPIECQHPQPSDDSELNIQTGKGTLR